jgi:hypothetical protein
MSAAALILPFSHPETRVLSIPDSLCYGLLAGSMFASICGVFAGLLGGAWNSPLVAIVAAIYSAGMLPLWEYPPTIYVLKTSIVAGAALGSGLGTKLTM